MVGKMFLAALAACGCVCAATAQEVNDGVNLGMMHWIRDTACASGDTIMFLPVSNDVPTLERTYAMVPTGHADAFTAHVVTPKERAWLTANGCRTKDLKPQYVAELTSGAPDSGGFDF